MNHSAELAVGVGVGALVLAAIGVGIAEALGGGDDDVIGSAQVSAGRTDKTDKTTGEVAVGDAGAVTEFDRAVLQVRPGEDYHMLNTWPAPS